MEYLGIVTFRSMLFDILWVTSRTFFCLQFFNNALMLGKSSESEVSDRLYDLIYELNQISPNVLLSVLPQLEFKLKVIKGFYKNEYLTVIVQCIIRWTSSKKLIFNDLWLFYLEQCGVWEEKSNKTARKDVFRPWVSTCWSE